MWALPGAAAREIVPAGAAPVRSCAAAADGSMAIIGRTDGSVEVIDLTTGRVTTALGRHTGSVRACLVSPDGRTAVTGGDDGFLRWHASDGALEAEVSDQAHAVSCLAMSRDGATLVSGGFDGSLRFYDSASHRVRHDVVNDLPAGVDRCAVGARVAIATHTDGALSVWDPVDGRLTGRLPGHTGDATGCALSPEDDTAASAGLDGTVRIWDLTQLQDVPVAGHRSTVTDCAVSADGSWAATTSVDGFGLVWDAVSGDVLHRLGDHFSAVLGCAIHPDGTGLATTGVDGFVHVYSDRGAGHRQALDLTVGGTSCIFGGDGAWLAAAGDDGQIRAWSWPDLSALPTLPGHAGSVSRLVAPSGSANLLSAGADGAIRLWDVRGGSCVGEARDAGPIDDLAVAADGTLISAGGDGRLMLRDLRQPGDSFRLDVAERAWLRCVVSADGSVLIGSDRQGEVWLANREDPARGRSLGRHADAVRALDLSRDGSILVSGGDDDLLTVTDVGRGRELARLPLPGRPTSVTWRSAGRLVLCGDDGGGVALARLDRFGRVGSSRQPKDVTGS